MVAILVELPANPIVCLVQQIVLTIVGVVLVVAKDALHVRAVQAAPAVLAAQDAPVVLAVQDALIPVQDAVEHVHLGVLAAVLVAKELVCPIALSPVHLLAIVDARTDAKAVQQDADQAAPMGVRGVLAVQQPVPQLVKILVKDVKVAHPLARLDVTMDVLVPATILVQQIADRLVPHNVMETARGRQHL